MPNLIIKLPNADYEKFRQLLVDKIIEGDTDDPESDSKFKFLNEDFDDFTKVEKFLSRLQDDYFDIYPGSMISSSPVGPSVYYTKYYTLEPKVLDRGIMINAYYSCIMDDLADSLAEKLQDLIEAHKTEFKELLGENPEEASIGFCINKDGSNGSCSFDNIYTGSDSEKRKLSEKLENLIKTEMISYGANRLEDFVNGSASSYGELVKPIEFEGDWLELKAEFTILDDGDFETKAYNNSYVAFDLYPEILVLPEK